jgi:hypothetical protein
MALERFQGTIGRLVAAALASWRFQIIRSEFGLALGVFQMTREPPRRA